MKITKDILFKIMEQENISSSSLKVIYDWVLAPDWVSVGAGVMSQNNLIFNSLYSASDHLADPSVEGSTDISTSVWPGISIGLENNILTHNDKGSFSGEDVLYVPNSSTLRNWTAFFDVEINAPQDKGKSRILMTSEDNPTDKNGPIVGVNGAGFLFYEFKKQNGDRTTRTLLKPLKEKNIIAVSKSRDSSLVSIFVYDPISHKSYGQEFSAEESLSVKNYCIGGTFNYFASDLEYERFSGDINHFLLFDVSMGEQKISNIFESFYITAYEAAHTADVATQFPKPGERTEVKIKDGIEIDRYENKESQITTGAGTTITVYDKTPVYKTKYKTITQYVTKEGTITVNVPTLISESKAKDEDYILTYLSDKCVLLDDSADITKYLEIYSCDEDLRTTSKVAEFYLPDATFELDKVYEDETMIQVYVDGLLLEKDIHYEINGKKIKNLQGDFTEANTLIYDIYAVSKVYLDFFEYNGDIWMAGEGGKDVYLDEKKLIKGVDYYDYPMGSSSPTYLIISGAGLPAGRLGIIGRYNNISETLSVTGKYLDCATSAVINELAWLDGKRVLKESAYFLTSSDDLNNSENLAPKKTITIYNNEEEFFNI